mgnify:CR=1 FL=1
MGLEARFVENEAPEGRAPAGRGGVGDRRSEVGNSPRVGAPGYNGDESGVEPPHSKWNSPPAVQGWPTKSEQPGRLGEASLPEQPAAWGHAAYIILNSES